MKKENARCTIVDARNTYNWALCIIKSKGYKLFLYPDEDENQYGCYHAIKDNHHFIGSDPLRLLGIVSLWENLGDNWRVENKLKHENLYSLLADRAFPNDINDFEEMSEIDFKNMVDDYRMFFEVLDNKISVPHNITRQQFFDIIDNYYKEN